MSRLDARGARTFLKTTVFLASFAAIGGTAHAACPVQPAPPPTEDLQGFKGRIFELDGKTMPYRLFIPTGYDQSKPYPLVLYLHHAGLVGTDNCIQLTEEAGSGGYGGVFVHQATDANEAKFDTQAKYPHFVVAPQATNSSYGFGGGVAGSATAPEHATHALIYGILDALSQEFSIDPRRRYVTGISMGCYGTWDMIMRKPDYFAAASPQSCRGDPNQDLLEELVEVPIWSMCGTNDSYFEGAQAMADAMTEVGAQKFVFTAMQGVGHSIHNLGYDYPGFIDWMFAQSLPEPPGSGGGGMGGGAGLGGGGASAGGAESGGASLGGAAVAMSGAAGTLTSGSPPASTAGASGAAASGAGQNGAASSSDSSSCAFQSPVRGREGFGFALAVVALSQLFRRRR
jgi:poly(3-hydroxybutyrate) depolymerase